MWKSRNNLLFHNIPINNKLIWSQKDKYIITPGKQLRSTLVTNLKWEPPLENWFKHGASADNPGNAGIGGIIRNHKSEFIVCKKY